MRQTIILANALIADFRQQFLKSTPSRLGITIRNFDFAFNEANLDRIDVELRCYEALKNTAFPLIGAVILVPKTITDCINLVFELNAYGIETANLPTTTALQVEIKTALCIVATVVAPLKRHHSTEYSAFDYGLTHAQTHYLKSQSIAITAVPSLTPTTRHFRVGLNIRHEIEAVVQDIIKQDATNVVVAIPNLSSHRALVDSVFARYNFKLGLYDYHLDLHKAQYLQILNLGLSPSRDALIPFLEANPLHLKTVDDILYYIQHFEMSYDEVKEPFRCVAETSRHQTMLALQERIQDDVQTLHEYLETIESLDYLGLLDYAYALLKVNNPYNLGVIHRFLEENARRYTLETHQFFEQRFAALQAPAQTHERIRVVDLKDLPFETSEHLYVLNLSATSFPSIPKRSGLLDENYVRSIAGFPSLDQRTAHDLRMQHRLFNVSSRLTLSYAASDYDGKGQDVAYPIEKYCVQHGVRLQPWAFQQVTQRTIDSLSLRPENARAIYLDEGRISGSISSFQMYLQDPRQFFIERGLKIHEPERLHFDARIAGTLNHEIVEHLFEPNPQDPWLELSTVFPDSPRLHMIRRRNDAMMILTRDHLKDAANDSDFEIMKRESRFDTATLFDSIRLRGIIDRIDQSGDALMIIDYKSTAQALSPAAVLAGEQIQLLTYALIAHHEYHKTIQGVFYYGFRSPTTSVSQGTYSFSRGYSANVIDAEDTWKESRKFKGWFFDYPEEHFESGDYVSGLRETLSGMSLWRPPYDFTKIQDVLFQIYDDLQRNILNGVLDRHEIELTVDTTLDLKKEAA